MRIIGMDAISNAPVNASPTQNANAGALQSGEQKTGASDGKVRSRPDNRDEYPVTEKTVSEAADRLNRLLEGMNRSCKISVHEKTNEIMVKIINDRTGEVIREVPPEKILDMIAGMMEMAGLIVDERR